jgi:hypothetical protein
MAESNTKIKTTKSSSSKTKHFNLLGVMAMSQTPVLMQLIERINEDYDLDKTTEMIERYIHKDNKVWKRMVKKFKPKNNRSKSGYTIFLSDPVMVDKIKSDNDGIMMKNLNPNKGEIWGKIKTDEKELYKKYCNVAKLFNNKLIEFDDDNQSSMRDLIKIWMYDKSDKELEELLKTIPQKQKKEKKSKKKVKKKITKVVDSSDESDNDKKEEIKKEHMFDNDETSMSFDFNETL